MKKHSFLKKVIIILLGMLSLPMYDKFEDIFEIEEYVIASSVTIYAFVFGFILHSATWGIPSIRLTLLLAVICNSSVYAYMIYKHNR